MSGLAPGQIARVSQGLALARTSAVARRSRPFEPALVTAADLEAGVVPAALPPEVYVQETAGALREAVDALSPEVRAEIEPHLGPVAAAAQHLDTVTRVFHGLDRGSPDAAAAAAGGPSGLPYGRTSP
ncbi:hypothetical protein Vafri_1125 [Volvox africanus]|nr:hypothetical protein Vafri_1125 [Volvox africanus]